MLTNRSHREVRFFEHRALCFDFEGSGPGFSFDVNPDATEPTVQAMNEDAYLNYLKCTSGGYQVKEGYLKTYLTKSIKDAEGDCHCGRRVVLSNHWTNECECGQQYNGSGQELAPVEQWGEETGEHYADVERVAYEDY